MSDANPLAALVRRISPGPTDVSDADLLGRLPALNLERARP